jgi:hypothetical protein
MTEVSKPQALVPRIDRTGSRGTVSEADWSRLPALALRRAQDGASPAQPTAVRIAHDGSGFLLRFDCVDRDIWGTHTLRDAPLWEEEVVEFFVAPGEDDPTDYVEIEVNPLGAIFDARVSNPHGRRDSMRVDAGWNAAGLTAGVKRPASDTWRAELVIPWRDLCDGAPPRIWRANLFRIERPRDGKDEYSCWSPTFADPPDFHRPAAFGRLVLED